MGHRLDSKMHIVGGYGESASTGPIITPTIRRTDRWLNRARLPRGANHVGVVADGGRVYALGGHLDQNRYFLGGEKIFEKSNDARSAIAEGRSAAAAVALDGKIHLHRRRRRSHQ